MSKPIFKNESELASYFKFTAITKADKTRLEKAWTLYVTDYKKDGCMGCVAEMLTATANSKKSTVSNAGKADCFIRYRTANGHIIPVSVERKTNGGRIQTLETEFSKAESMNGKYIVYSMDICNSTTGNRRRYVPAVVIPKALFLEKLMEFNAIKRVNHGGVCDGLAIQVSSKALYTWLADWPIAYDRNAVYCDDDFDGLE